MHNHIQVRLIEIAKNNNNRLTGTDFQKLYGSNYKNEISKWMGLGWLIMLRNGIFTITKKCLDYFYIPSEDSKRIR